MKFNFGVAAIIVTLFATFDIRPARGDLVGIDFRGTVWNVSLDAMTTEVGSTGIDSIADIAFAPDGRLFGLTTSGSNAGGSVFFELDPVTAVATVIGPTNVGFVSEGGLAFASNSVAYGTNSGPHISQLELFRIDVGTGAATSVGLIAGAGATHDINGLAWRIDGKLLGLDGETNSLIIIDPETAQATTLSTLVPQVSGGGGMTIVGGVGYFSGGWSPGQEGLWRFDPFSGAHELAGFYAPSFPGSISGIAGRIPEPSTALSFAIGVMWLLIVRHRHVGLCMHG